MHLEDLLIDPLQYPLREEVDALVDEAMRCLPSDRSDLSSRVSHAIRTPLAAILGFKEVLELDERVTDEERQTYSAIVLAETHRLRRFIHSLMLFRSFLTGGLSNSRTSDDIRRTVAEAVLRCRLDAENKSVRVNLIEGPDGILVVADHPRLCLALEHMLVNALRATPKEGIIDIEILQQPDAVNIIIEDSGYGMDPAQIDSLFKPFRRIPRPDDNGGELGIGLTIVRSIAEWHQGAVTATSIPMDGSRFTITIPR